MSIPKRMEIAQASQGLITAVLNSICMDSTQPMKKSQAIQARFHLNREAMAIVIQIQTVFISHGQDLINSLKIIGKTESGQ